MLRRGNQFCYVSQESEVLILVNYCTDYIYFFFRFFYLFNRQERVSWNLKTNQAKGPPPSLQGTAVSKAACLDSARACKKRLAQRKQDLPQTGGLCFDFNNYVILKSHWRSSIQRKLQARVSCSPWEAIFNKPSIARWLIPFVNLMAKKWPLNVLKTKEDQKFGSFFN